ncbi:MAG: histidine phosphatase family protein [Erysipelotrichaceae bacterium]|nr:histidine phosphatase family protein [Erysipelotrichaceae bacterium]
MKTLYLMRHGQTMFNVAHKIQGWCDAPLTDLGRAQAEVAGQWFRDRNITFDYAYSSTSERAADTLEIVTGGQMPYERIRGLKEWFFGKLEGHDESLNPSFPYGDQFKQYGGEGELEFQTRFSETVRTLMNYSADNTTTLIVAHGAALGQFFNRWQDYSLAERRRGIGNCAIYRYSFDGVVFICEEIVIHDFSSLDPELSKTVYITNGR